MNERIHELAAEAEDYADSIVDQGGEFHLAYTQKFAELIIRECQLVINNIDATDASMTQGLYHAEYSIGKHFGIEQ